MDRVVNALSAVFGWMFIALSVLVALETVSRKLFNFSFQGADELGGYALAVGSSLAFSVALVERAHIRIDLLHEHLPVRVQAALNWISIVLMAALGLFLIRYGWLAVRDTLDYGSTAATPWATPLIYPQSVWYAALVAFALVAVWLAVRATRLLLAGRIEDLNRDFHPKGALEELSEELEDVGRR
jgi:TRAP-type C4-dicarboxylate transport system permease small subunit